MIFEPDFFLSKYVKTVQDIYRNRSFLKQLSCIDSVVQLLASIIISAVETEQRFRQLDCLKVLRAIVKDRHDPELSQETVSLLFKLYKHYIFDHREDIQWCISALLRGRQLRDSELSWIIERYKESEHLANRLLRYPVDSPLVYNWVKKIYDEGGIDGRNSELLGLMIRDCLPDKIKNESKETLIWAVFYSRANINIKAALLEELYSEENVKSFIEVCMRLELPLVMNNILRKFYG